MRVTKWSLRAAVLTTVLATGVAGAVAGAAPAAVAAPASVAPAPDAPAPDAPAPDLEAPAPAPAPTDETVTPAPTPAPTDGTTPTPVPTLAPPPEKDEDAVAPDAVPPVAAALPRAGRIGGTSLYARSVLASQAAFPSGAGTVLVASGSAQVGPVVAASMAGRRAAPLLYVTPTGIPSAVAGELRRLDPDRIVMVGSDGDASRALIDALRAIAPVERMLLTSRYQASQLALSGAPAVNRVYVTGNDLLHLAAASSAAASVGGAALLVNPAGSPTAGVLDTLRALQAREVVIVGSTASVSAGYANALAGAGYTVSRVGSGDVFAVSRALAQQRPGAASRVFAANPAILADAASASALAAVTGQPMVYTAYTCMMTPTSDWIRSMGAGVVGVGKANWLRDPAVANTACAVEKPRREVALYNAIRGTLAGYPGNYSVSVRDLGRVGEVVGIEQNSRLEPASMMKLYAAYVILRLVQDGRLTLDNSILPSGYSMRTCIHAMLQASDNFCHNDLVHWVGIGEMNRIIQAAGFTQTSYGSVPYGASVLYAGNRTTTADLTKLVSRLEQGTLLNSAMRSVLLGEMHGQIFRSRLASGLPPGVWQGSKPGSLWIPSGLLQADTAIVRGPQGSFAVSVIGVDGPSKAAISAVARVVYTHYNEPFGAAASYPVQQMVSTSAVAFRESPAGRAIATMPVRVYVEVTDAQRVWYKVWWAGRLGWVDSRALRGR